MINWRRSSPGKSQHASHSTRSGSVIQVIDYLKALESYLVELYRHCYGKRSIWSGSRWLCRFPAWYKSLSRTPIEDGRPWLPYDAIKFLEAHLSRDMRAFEYGVGGSTKFLLQRVACLISVEHDKVWAERIKGALRPWLATKWRLFVFPPQPTIAPISREAASESKYLSQKREYIGMDFTAYVKSIDQYPDDYFDVILVDGRSRVACVTRAAAKIRKGGYLILDDAERERYKEATSFLNSLHWTLRAFSGPVPHCYGFGTCIVWQRT